MNIEVLLHRIAVKPFDFNDWDEGRKKAKELGFALPETEREVRAQASVDIGTITQIGPTAFKDFTSEIPVQVGDVISYVKNAGKTIKDPFKHDGESVVVLNDEDVIAVLTKDI